jgi:geranylgeranyl pyrophosphate synthase
MGYAYFCARCVATKTDATDAEELAGSLGLTLWNPRHEVTYDFPQGALACRAAMDSADAIICQTPIGNDCSWELGYAVGTGKTIFVLGELAPDDWMTKIDVQYVQAPAQRATPEAATAATATATMSKTPEIHPFGKSLPNYIRIGYEYAARRPLPDDLLTRLHDVSLLDTSVLVIDDILDSSRERAGRPCLHRERGVNTAIVEAMLMSSRSITALGDVAEGLGTAPEHLLRIHQLANAYTEDMYTGQRLDLAARQDPGFGDPVVERYQQIISLITSSHVCLGFAWGQLLADRAPDPALDRAGRSVGLVRQMLDDFHDYFDDHHEPFGDFKGGLNRLPEILFKQAGGIRADVLAALAQGRTTTARELVLTERTRTLIYDRCAAQLSALVQVDAPVDLFGLAGDIGPVLSRRA